MEKIDFIALFVMALSMSLSHCVGMCGGIVMAYSRVLDNKVIVVKFLGHLLYGMGRISSYVVIGIVCVLLGSVFTVNPLLKASIFIAVGILMFIIGFSLLIPRILRAFEINFFAFRIFRDLFSKMLQSKSIFSVYAIGVLNGLLPCGMVYFFALSASISGSVVNGALVMAVFGVATMIPMIAFGAISSLLLKVRIFFVYISSILISAFGVYSIFKGVKMIIGASM